MDKVKITLGAPFKVSGKPVHEIILSRMPTGADFEPFSAEDVLFKQRPKALAHVISKISDPFIPAETLLEGPGLNFATLGESLNYFLDAWTSPNKVEKIDDSSSSPSPSPTKKSRSPSDGASETSAPQAS